MPSADRAVYESTAANNRFVANATHLLKKRASGDRIDKNKYEMGIREGTQQIVAHPESDGWYCGSCESKGV